MNSGDHGLATWLPSARLNPLAADGCGNVLCRYLMILKPLLLCMLYINISPFLSVCLSLSLSLTIYF